MTTASICLFVAIAALVAVFYYGWWSIIRVILFRRDICMRRDELAEYAGSSHALDDLSFRLALDTFESVAGMVSCISLRSIEYMSSTATPLPPIRSINAVLQQVIDDSVAWLVRRITDYVMKESLHGIMYSLAYGNDPVRSIALGDMERKVRLVVCSDIVNNWESHERVREAEPDKGGAPGALTGGPTAAKVRIGNLT
jgi:hypothetical protein